MTSEEGGFGLIWDGSQVESLEVPEPRVRDVTVFGSSGRRVSGSNVSREWFIVGKRVSVHL